MSYNKYGLFIDYGDAVNTLVEAFSKCREESFYFFEACQNKGLFDECRSYEDVEVILLSKGKCDWDIFIYGSLEEEIK